MRAKAAHPGGFHFLASPSRLRRLGEGDRFSGGRGLYRFHAAGIKLYPCSPAQV